MGAQSILVATVASADGAPSTWAANAQAVRERTPQHSIDYVVVVEERVTLDAVNDSAPPFLTQDIARVIGLNTILQAAADEHNDWLLTVGPGYTYPADSLEKLLELAHPLVGGSLRTLGNSGPAIPDYDPKWRVVNGRPPVEFCLTHFDVYRYLRWRTDAEAQMGIAECWQHDARRLLGIQSYVRGDLVAT
jgi:hypothetical protein